MKTKPFNLEEAKAGAPFIVYHNQPARYVGTWHNTRYPHVIEYGHRITEGEGSLALCAIDAKGNTTSAGQCYMLVPEPVYPDWIIQAARHNEMPWIAQDENLGVWIYRTEPRIRDTGFGNGGGGCFILTDRADIGVPWQDSLLKIDLADA